MNSGLRGSALLCLAVSAVILGACSKGPGTLPGPASTVPVTALGQDGYDVTISANYVIRPMDVLRVDVFREEDLSADSITVSASGDISLPLLGQMRVAGLTPAQLEQQLTARLGQQYLRQPDVTVNVLQYQSHVVTVEGQVTDPGLYQFRPGTRLSGAIALAKGTTRVAEVDDIAVFREVPGGIEVAKFDYGAVRAGTMLDPVLRPGDRVVVGTDSLSQFWQDLLRSLPLFALFTRV